MPILPVSSDGEQKPPLSGGFISSSTVQSNISSSNHELLNSEVPAASTGAWPPVNTHKSHPLPFLPSLPMQKFFRNQFDSMNTSNSVVDHSLNKSFVHHQLGSIENKAAMSNLPQFPHQQSQAQIPMLQPQSRMPHEVRQNFVPSPALSTPSHLFVPPPFNHGYIPQGHGPSTSTVMSNSLPSMQSSMRMPNIPNPSLPPLPSGPPPTSSQLISGPQNLGLMAPNPPPGGAFSGLISSLMSQGLISFTEQALTQVYAF